MKKKLLKQRASAVERYFAGEDPESICASQGKTTRWLYKLYKWILRLIQLALKISLGDRSPAPTAPLRRSK